LLPRGSVDGKELCRELTKAFDQKLKQVRQAKKKVPDPFRVARWIILARRMVFLPVAQATVAVATDNDQFVIIAAACDVMKLQRQRVFAGAKRAPRIIRTQSFECLLPATLKFQLLIVHGQGSFK
jgi:hypothetical protein